MQFIMDARVIGACESTPFFGRPCAGMSGVCCTLPAKHPPVIPGRAESANPESRNDHVMASGFRVRRA